MTGTTYLLITHCGLFGTSDVVIGAPGLAIGLFAENRILMKFVKNAIA